MGNTTGIEWTDATWNPIRGCSRVSEGCRNCYAERVAYRFSGKGQPYEGLAQLVNGHPSWTGKVELVEKHLLDPLKWKGRPIYDASDGYKRVGFGPGMRIFVNSMSDLFHENVADEWIDRIFAVMALCPQHTFQILTKRPERMLAYSRTRNRATAVMHAADVISSPEIRPGVRRLLYSWPGWPLPNVQLGVSVEDQKAADERIPLLLQTAAAVRFISAEPLLGGIDLVNINAMVWFREYMAKINPHEAMRQANSEFYPKYCPMDVLTGECAAVEPELQERLDWVIVGGESGPRARPMDTAWVQQIVDQCRAASVPVFVKQLGAHVIQDGERRIKKDRKGKDMDEWPHELRVREFPDTTRGCSVGIGESVGSMYVR